MSQTRISPRIFLTDGPHIVEPQNVRLYNMADPERIRYVLFFRTEDDRTGYLQALRDLALDPTPISIEQVQPEMDKARRLYDPAGILRSGLRWWCCAQKKTYHAYKLRASVPPFNFSAITFLIRVLPRSCGYLEFGIKVTITFHN